MSTSKGRDLAARLAPAIGYTRAIDETCSLIARHATSYERIQQRWCNDEMSDAETARVEAREARLERRIADLVADLPATDDGPWSVTFEGDPRGYVVKITAPGAAEQAIRANTIVGSDTRAVGVA